MSVPFITEELSHIITLAGVTISGLPFSTAVVVFSEFMFDGTNSAFVLSRKKKVANN